jgi:hypothetical protein
MATITINGETLQMQTKPRLIFAANDIENRGRSHKSYSILIPRNTHNNTILGGVFDRLYNRTIRFAALYAYETEILEGDLVIIEMTKRHARALFISGNGSLWDKLADKKLNSGFDWSAYDEVLTLTVVKESEFGNLPILYDLSDRGAFINGDSIDISERYPAVQVGTLLREIFNQSGVGLTWNVPTAYADMIQEEAFLLFTQDNAIRNDADWERTAPYAAEDSGDSYERNGEVDETNAVWETLLPLMATLDEGSNYSDVPNYRYTVPETGTYRIKLEVASFSITFEDNTGGFPKIIFDTVQDRARISFEIRKNGTALHRNRAIRTLTGNNWSTTDIVVDTMPIELTAADEITAYILIEYDSQLTSPNTSAYFAVVGAGSIEGTVSRWYGAGSTVQLSEILPDTNVLTWLGGLFKYLNIDVFYQLETNQIELWQGAQEQPVIATIDVFDYEEKLTERLDYELAYTTDKALPPANDTITFTDAQGDQQIAFDYSRTLIAPCYRLTNEMNTMIPVLWNELNPNSYIDQQAPPRADTKGNMRIVRFVSRDDAFFTVTFGGDVDTNSSSDDFKNPRVDELPIKELWHQSLTPEIVQVECYAELTAVQVRAMYNQSWFKQPLTLRNRDTGAIYGTAKLLEAEQAGNRIYKLILERI